MTIKCQLEYFCLHYTTKTEASKPEESKKKEEPITGKVDKVNVDCAEGTLTYKKHEVVNDDYQEQELALQ